VPSSACTVSTIVITKTYPITASGALTTIEVRISTIFVAVRLRMTTSVSVTTIKLVAATATIVMVGVILI
jgi:hypothetical protein